MPHVLAPEVPPEARKNLHKLKIARTIAERKARDPVGYKAVCDKIIKDSKAELPPPTAETCCDYRGRMRNRLGIPHVPGCKYEHTGRSAKRGWPY